MRFAVATLDGNEINQHFGHAGRFLIFEVNGNEVRQVGEKQVERYCTYDQDHPLRGHILKAIAASLSECRAIVCSQIGPAPQMEMERLGFDTYVADGPIGPTLVELARVL